MFAYEDLVALLGGDRAAGTARARISRTTRRSPSAAGAGTGSSARSWRSSARTPKRWVARGLLERTGFADDPWLERDMRAYFPDAVVERCGHLLGEHPLRTQLICMINANSVVNALGPTFVSSLVAERGADVAAVVRAYLIACDVTGATALWEAVEGLDGVERSAQAELLGGVDTLVKATARWYLTWAPGAPLEETIASGRDGFARLAAVLPDLGTEERRRRREETVGRLLGEGVPARIARAHALAAELVHTPNMVAVAAATGRSRTSPACSSRSGRSCGWTGWSAASRACGRRRGCSGGRCRPCARTR